MDFGSFERNAWKFATLGVTAVVLTNIILNPRGVVQITRQVGESYVSVLRTIRA
jgi:hypothetical protein